MIFLYSKLDIQNKGEGLGSLQDFVEEPIVTWNASGFLEVEFKYFLYGDLAEYMIPDAKLKTRIHSNDEVYHLFTIYEVEPDYIENTVQVRAEMTLLHELKDRVVPAGTMRGTANELIMFVKNRMDRDYPFVITGTTDKTVFIEHDNISAYELIFGEDGILKRTGAEIEFTDRGIRVSDRIGTIHRDELRESDFVSNLTVNELQGEDFVTRIIPFTTVMFDRPVRDGDRYTRETIETPTYGTPVISPNITNKLYKVRTKFVEYRNEPTDVPKYYNYQTDRGTETLEMSQYIYEDVTALNQDASTFFEDNQGVDEPTTTVTIETLGLAKGYYTYLRYLNRYDIVTIYVEPKPYLTNNSETYVVQVNETVYEPLSDNLVSIGFTNDSMTLRDAYRNVNEGRISGQQLQAELQKERLRDLEDKLVNYVYNYDGFRLEFGNVLPPPDEYREGDMYYLETGEGIDLYKLVNGAWEFVVGQSTREIIEGKFEELEPLLQGLSDEIEASEGRATEKANQALEDAKAYAEAEDARIKQEVDGAIEIAEQAKQDAIDKANQALVDAKAHADSEILQFSEHFDGVLAEVESDVADAQSTADSAVNEINTAVTNAGFTSLDDTIRYIDTLSSDAQATSQRAITNASDAYGLAQTSISEAQTAQANSLSALGKADNALDGVSNLDVRVDDVEAELELKADNTYMTEDGEVITLSNAITLNAHRFSSDMHRIESRVESLAGAINLVVLRDAIKGYSLIGGEVYPNVTYASPEIEVMRELIDVEPEEQLALTKEQLDHSNNVWRINYYDDDMNYKSRVTGSSNELIITIPSGVTKMWVSYPAGSKPQIVRGTDFLPYRPNMADQMTTNEMVLFRNEYDEFADKTERRLTAIDSSDGRLATAELLITQTADGLALKADQTTVNELTNEVENLGTEFDVVAGQVSSKVWMTDIDNIEVGGRNLLRGTPSVSEWETKSYMMTAVINNTVLPTGEVGDVLEIGSNEANRGWLRFPYDKMEINKEYTFSIWIKRATTGGVLTTLINVNGDTDKADRVAVAVNQDWQRIKVTSKVTRDPSIFGFVEIKPFTYTWDESARFYIWHPQLETGSIMTDWTPAPEDTDAKIDHIQTEWTQTFDTFSQTVSGIDGRVSAQKQTIDTISSTVSGHGGRLSAVEQTASGLQSTVADKANQSQVTQLANGLSSVVTDLDNLEVGGRNLFIRTTAVTGVVDSDGSLQTNGIVASESLTTYPILRVKSGETYRFTKISTGEASRDTWRIALFSGTGLGLVARITNSSDSLPLVVPEGVTSMRVSIAKDARPKIEKGNKATHWTPAPEDVVTQSQITQLQNNINLRVSKGDIINQINVSTEGILIDGKKTHITGTTTIDNGVIKDAHIANLNADKINAGTINSDRINATEIVAQGLTTNVIKSDHILADNALIDNIFANQALVDRLWAKSIWTNKISAMSLDASQITAGEIETARLKVTEIVSQGLSGNEESITNLVIGEDVFTSSVTNLAQQKVADELKQEYKTVTSKVNVVDGGKGNNNGEEYNRGRYFYFNSSDGVVQRVLSTNTTYTLAFSTQTTNNNGNPIALHVRHYGSSEWKALVTGSMTSGKQNNTFTFKNDVFASSVSDYRLMIQSVDGKNVPYIWGFELYQEVEVEVPTTSSNTGAISSKITQLYDMINLSVLGKEGALSRIAMGEEGIQIDGKLLHITAKTYIDDAVIKSAMIDTLDAGKITTGELNASLVRVVNLDANSITGNEASFIKALFSGTKSTLQITGSGVRVLDNSGRSSTYLDSSGIEFSRSGINLGELQYVTNTTESGDLNGMHGFAMRPNRNSYFGISYFPSDGATTSVRRFAVSGKTGNIYVAGLIKPSEAQVYGIDITWGTISGRGTNVRIYNHDRTGGIQINSGDLAYLTPNGWRSLNDRL